MGRGGSGQQLPGVWRRTRFAGRDSGQSEPGSQQDREPAAQPELGLLSQRGHGQLLQLGESPSPRPTPLPKVHRTCQPSPASEGQQLARSPTPTQPDIAERPRWQPEDEKLPEPQPLSLPADLPSQQTLQSSDAATSSKDPISQPALEASQEAILHQLPSPASADPSSPGDPESSLLILHLSPPRKAAEDPRAQESPCSQLSTAPTQSSPPESPQLLVPTKPNLDITWTSQPLEPLDSSSDPGSPENPRPQPSEVMLAEHAHFQCPKGPGALGPPAAPDSDWQESQARSRPRVAELKKCFEG